MFAPKKYCSDILDSIGHSPLVKLNKIPQEEGIQCDMYVKCEYSNPGGSVKDRIAHRMIIEAEKAGQLTPGKSVLVEATSGNTGIGIALVAVVKGYKCIMVVPEKDSDEKVATLLALGAEVVRTPDAGADSPDNDVNVAKRLVEENKDKGYVMLGQFSNPVNSETHYYETSEEILWALDNDLDMVVIGAGSGGTISGVGKKMKEKCPKCRVIGVDPYGSYLAVPDSKNKTDVKEFEVEGIGGDVRPKVLDMSVVDDWVKTYDKDSFLMARRLISEEGILCGESSGAALWAAIQQAKSLKVGQKCVVMLADGIRNYLMRFVSDPWMQVRGYMPLDQKGDQKWWDEKLTETNCKWIIETKKIKINSSVQDALDALDKCGKGVLHVVKEDGSIAGVFTADYTRKRLTNKNGNLSENLDKFTLKKFYKVDLRARPCLGLISRMLDIVPFVVVTKTKENQPDVSYPVGIITSDVLLEYVLKFSNEV